MSALDAARIVARQIQAHRVRGISDIRSLEALAPMPPAVLDDAIDELVARGALLESRGPRGFLLIRPERLPA